MNTVAMGITCLHQQHKLTIIHGFSTHEDLGGKKQPIRVNENQLKTAFAKGD